MSKKLHRRKQHGAVFLDPENVGSSIRWNTDVNIRQQKGSDTKPPHTTASIHGEVYLTDCGESISWNHYGETAEDINRKIDRAINELREFQRAINAAERAVKKYHTDPLDEGDDE